MDVYDQLPLEILDRIDEPCGRFEAALRRGESPSAEGHVADFSGEARAALLAELLRLEWHYRGPPNLAAACARFPGDESVVRAVWAELDAGTLLYDPSADTAGPHAGDDAAPRLPAGLECVGLIGQGGMGRVYRARDLTLGRDLAVKVARGPASAGELARRFAAEAAITARLQHPNVVPVHQYGTLDDGRPFMAMKLVEGRTLSAWLRDKPAVADVLPAFVRVCEAVGFAHSRGVVHRDLKPANVMVGAFGEVQVMDWGLAKVRGGGETASAAAGPDDAGLTSTGAAMGTAAYMPPEQARGEIDRVGPASDVFGLGAILCEALTGRPPFTGDAHAALSRSAAGDLADAHSRLDVCRADPELVELCRRCLSADAASRPADGGAAAAEVSAHLAAAQRRLHDQRVAAERQRVRARWRTVLAVALSLLAAVPVIGYQWVQLRDERAKQEALTEADNRALPKAEEARQLIAAARRDPLRGRGLCQRAVKAAGEAVKLAEGARPAARRAAADALALAEREAEAAGRDARLVSAIGQLMYHDEGHITRRSGPNNRVLHHVQNSAQDLYARAFAEWGVDVLRAPTAEAAAAIAARPPAAVAEIIAGLDEWGTRSRRAGMPASHYRKVFALADRLDRSPRRKRLRRLLASGALEREAAAAAVAAAMNPWAAVADPAPGSARAELAELTAAADPARESPLGVLLLAKALAAAGDADRAGPLLRAAAVARPGAAGPLMALGRRAASGGRWGLAAEYFRAARVIAPGTGLLLCEALTKSGRHGESDAILRQMAADGRDDVGRLSRLAVWANAVLDRPAEAARLYRRILEVDPGHVGAGSNLVVALSRAGRAGEAIAAGRRAVAERPENPHAHYALADALAGVGRHAEAVPHYRESLKRSPENYAALNNLASALERSGKPAEAVTYYRRALRIEPDLPLSQYNLAILLCKSGRHGEAVGPLKRCLRSAPDHVMALYTLASALIESGRPAEAVPLCRRAIRLAPDDAVPWHNLGYAYRKMGRHRDAIDAYRNAVRIRPRLALSHVSLVQSLTALGRLGEALPHARRAAELDRRWGGELLRLAEALHARGDRKRAIDAYRALAELFPGDPTPRARLGELTPRRR